MSRSAPTAPLTFAQERLWFVDRLQPGLPVYNLLTLLQPGRHLHAAIAQASVDALVRRHGQLRARFEVTDGHPCQQELPATATQLPVIDLSGLDPAAGATAGQRLLWLESRLAFDLGRGPHFRPRQLRMTAHDDRIILSFHHIVVDGWSLGILLRELSALYAAFERGAQAALPEPVPRYTDFAAEQRQRLTGPHLERLLGYWRRQLQGAPTLLQLPTDRPRPAVQTFTGVLQQFLISTATTTRLQQLANEEQATLVMALLALFGGLLCRYSGQRDLLIGLPTAGRTRSELEGIVGLFTNTLVLRLDLSAELTFRELLRQVRETSLDALTYEELPFERLVTELAPQRSLSHNPLFQVMLAPQAPVADADAEPRQQERPLPAPVPTLSKFDLTLLITPTGDRIWAGFEANSDLFDPATLAQMALAFQELAADAGRRPDQAIGALSAMSESQRRQVSGWSRAGTSPVPLLARFEAQVAVRPDAVACEHADEHITYRDLDRRAHLLAQRLRGLGVGAEVPVGIFLGLGADRAIAVLAILKAGGAFLPLDEGYPDERLAFMIEDTRLRFVVSDPALSPRMAGRVAHVVTVWSPDEPLALRLSDAPVAVPGAAIDGQQLACVIYTSGSTGRPKGVGITQAGLAQVAAAVQERFTPRPADRVMQFASISFDGWVFELCLSLAAGAALHLPGSRLLPGPELIEQLELRRITSLLLSPSALAALAGVPLQGVPLPGLRALFVGGEVLPREVMLRWQGERRFFNVYGPTEGPVCVTAWRCRDTDGPSPIGTPLPGCEVHLLDGGLRLLPQGAVGEIYIGGPRLSRGYLDRPGLTADRFIPDPLSGRPGRRLYRTGDLARHRSDGMIEFLGRRDAQVKLRGFRVELEEIESFLMEHPAVAEAAVAVITGAATGDRLAAYFVPRPGQSVTAEELRETLRGRLPAYMVPALWTSVPALPLTASGKLDRARLLQVEPESSDSQVEEEPPTTPLEQQIAAIWAEVLEIEQVGRHQSFFDLGGHSLLMARVLSRIKDRLALSLSLRAFMEGATVAQLAAAAREVEAGEAPTLGGPHPPPQTSRPRSSPGPRPSIPTSRRQRSAEPSAGAVAASISPSAPPAARTGRRFLPLSFAQERLWFLDQLHPRSTAYNVPWLLPLSLPPALALLRRCVEEIVRRHAVLRTRFAIVEGQPRQQILPSAEVPVGVVDLRGLPTPLPEAMAQRLSAAAAQQPFDVANGPHLRVTLLHVGRQQHLLAVIFHHLVADGWSVSLFQRELTSLYNAFAAGSDSPLPPLPLQYFDYALEQRQRLASGELADQLAFWIAELADAPALLELPTDRPRPPVLSLAGGTLVFPLSTSAAEGLRALSRSSGTTLFAAVLAAFSALLYRYSGQRDILIGSPTANRNRPQLEALIGFFTNTVVLRCRPEASLSFEDWVRRTGEVVLRALSHQEYPFERLVDALHSQRDLSHNPLFQVMLALHNMPSSSGPSASAPSATAQRDGVEEASAPPPPLVGPALGAKFDLTLNVSEATAGMQCSLDFSSDLFDPTTAARMTQHLRVLIAGAVAQPQLAVGDLPLLPAAELRQVVVEWNRTAVDLAAPPLLHQMFERQAERDPGAVALVAGDQQMSYGRLDACAQRLAVRLRGYGVGPEVPVGVCMERSFELVVALVAVLKAGGAYVPFDPAYPPQRLASLHEQTGAPILLVQESLRELWRDAPCQVLGLGADDLDELDELDEVGGSDEARRPLAPPAADNACYVIFTSGSTGAPKGVVIPHRAAVNHMAWMCRQWPLEPQDLVLHKTAVSFDASVWEIFVPLASGARLYLAPPGSDRDPRALAGLLRRSGATVLQLVPSMAQALFAEPELARCDRLRRLFLGGEALPRALAERFFGLHSAELVNLYGPTEATIQAVIDIVPRATDSPADAQRPTAPIGRPIANLCAYVADRRLQPLPIGVPGELLLGGAGVGRGYLQRPALTAERFIPDPFSNHQGGDRAGARLYRTGDRVRHLLDGRLEFLGREDDQVKLHGFRIEPGEIAAVLQRCSEVAEAAVVLREDRPGDPRLIAYVVPAGASEALEPTLRRFLAERLPEHMVPSHFLVLSQMPRKPNGKLDRAALPAPGSARPQLAGSYVAPATALEEALAEIWQEVLGLDKVGANDRFFDLGGHSLLATQVLARLRETFDADVPVRALFEQPSVAGLAAALLAVAPDAQRIERIAELYLAVARMSEDEVDRRLANRANASEGRQP